VGRARSRFVGFIKKRLGASKIAPLPPTILTKPVSCASASPWFRRSRPTLLPWPLHHRDYLCFLVGARFGCAPLRPGARRSLRRGLLSRPLGGRDAGRTWRTVRGQTRNSLPDTRDGGLAAGDVLDRLQSSNDVTPAKLFQVSTRRETGHSAVSLASFLALENDCDSSAPDGSVACAVMLW
jgi:hypothetical protein